MSRFLPFVNFNTCTSLSTSRYSAVGHHKQKNNRLKGFCEKKVFFTKKADKEVSLECVWEPGLRILKARKKVK